MSSDERNRRMKYGQDVPRSWIADFNVTHRSGTGGGEAMRNDLKSSPSPRDLKAQYELKRRTRVGRQRQQLIRASKDLRALQNLVALLMVLVGFLLGGFAGTAIGALVGLCISLFRLKL